MKNTVFQVSSIIKGRDLSRDGRKMSNIYNPYDSSVVAKAVLATANDAEQAINCAHRVFQETMKNMPAYRRSDILRSAAHLLEERAGQFATVIALEAGKPIRDARAEVGRAIQVLKFAADRAKLLHGELVPMDAAVGGENRIGMVRRYPIGVVTAIVPFNFPLNLALHKLAPAFAAGNTVVLKPAMKTPVTAYNLVKLFEEAGLPGGALNLIVGESGEVGDALVMNPKVQKVTFTGSPAVGIQLLKKAGLKKVTLELGSNSPNIIFRDANLDLAVTSLVRGAFAYAGQICISAQRIYVERAVCQQFVERYVEKVKELRLGDPLLETTDVGPMISEEEAKRAEQWVQEAVDAGAKVLTGGTRNGSMFAPTVLVDVTQHMKIVCQEVFAPVVSIIPFDEEEEVIRLANESDFGLQAGVFTSDINRAMRLADRLETGGVWINETSTYRQDNIPYGGVKLSGIGKEGVDYAIEEMTAMKFVGIRLT
jgi:acyl-CoA reductase-like NAD-dependent aldehyde dehydrogenase